MQIIDDDIVVIEEWLDDGQVTDSYTGDVKSYTADVLYLLFVGSQDNTSVAKPTGVTGTGLNWVEVIDTIGSIEQQTLYVAVPTANTSTAITVTFDTNQEDCAWNILELNSVEVTGTDGENAIVQKEVHNVTDVDWANTLTNAVKKGNLVIVGLWQSNGTLIYTAGAGQTAITTEAAARHGFVMYNLDELELTEASISASNLICGIVAEIRAAVGVGASVDLEYNRGQ